MAPSKRAIMWQVLAWLKSRLRLVITGTLGFAMTPVSTDASMGSAVSVEGNIEQRSSARVTLLSRLAVEKDLALRTKKALDLQQSGPRSLDRHLERGRRSELLDVPQYRRGFVWSNSFPDTVSPAAQSTEVAAPLPPPPYHFLDDPIFLKTLKSLDGFIKVDTPFNINRFEAVLHDHPNQPFVKSVIWGL